MLLEILKSSRYEMATTALVSSIVGVLFTCVMLALISSIYHLSYGLVKVDSVWELLFGIVTGMLSGIMLFPIGFIIVSPLIVIAMLCAAIFRDDIEKHLRFWCYLSAILVWLVICAFVTCMTYNNYSMHSFIESFFTTLTRMDSLVYLMGPAVASVVFYHMSIPQVSTVALNKPSSTLPEPWHQHNQQGQELNPSEQHREGHHPDR